jgi:hypothetical protein
MKKLLISLFLATFCLSLSSQDILTATMTSSSRLFGDKDDLTSVILIIPKDSRVEVIAVDSVYFYVFFEGDEGFILKRHAVIDQTQTPPQQTNVLDNNSADEQPTSRFAYLENKYGKSIAERLDARKIWRGMSAEMVRDSWGTSDQIDREISGNTVRERWIYRNTLLYLENNTLINWAPVVR